MLLRVWHGWTAPEDADEYERLVAEDVIPDVAAEAGDAFAGYEVGRREGDGEVEFLTVLRFESEGPVATLVDADDPEVAHVPPAARELLTRYEERTRHYELRASDGDG